MGNDDRINVLVTSNIDLKNQLRNTAITALTFDVEFLLQLSVAGNVLVTIAPPAGPGGIHTVFHVWEGEGLDATGNEDYSKIIHTFRNEQKDAAGAQAAWEQAVRQGYMEALDRAFVLAREARNED